MSEGLFRKAAVDKVSSPEQLDLLMRVTSPAGWIALVTVAALIVAAGVWSVVASIPDLVDGRGTFFRGERTYDVKATMSGTIVSMKVEVGTLVEAGRVVASLRRDRAAIEQRDADAMTIEKNQLMIARKRQELATLQRQRELQQALVNQGLKAPKELLSLDLQMNGVRGEIDSLQAEVRQIQAQAQATADVISAETGRVIEVLKQAGERVREDEPLFRVEPQSTAADQYCGGNVHVILYVPASAASKVRDGNLVRVSPAGVTREEYGFILGKIALITRNAASTARMTETLKNDQLVREFTADGPVHEARVCLELKEGAPASTGAPGQGGNPFRWSSSQGPPNAIDAGTTCTASVVVGERKPYTYIIPKAKSMIGM